MISRRVVERTFAAGVVIPLLLFLSPSVALAHHNGDWDPLANKSCDWGGSGPLGDEVRDNLEHQVIEGVDAQRTAQGLPNLVTTSCISMTAAFHSYDMITYHVFEHVINGKGPADRLQDNGIPFSAWGENQYCEWSLPDWPVAEFATDAVTWWMNSTGHRANILNTQWTHAGIGVWEGFGAAGENYICVTQDFVEAPG
jgi:uncharacterized protein YkwD